LAQRQALSPALRQCTSNAIPKLALFASQVSLV
jgi:hypothetical protein